VKRRPTYANVVATLALVLAIGGTTVAGASSLMTGRDIQDDSVTGADIQNGSLTGADIRPGSLGSNSLSLAARTNLRGARGDAGPQGDTGATGPQGAPGVGVTTVNASGDDVTNYQDLTTLATATLPKAGDYVIFARLEATNTGTTDDNLNCGLFTDPTNEFGGGGASVTAGAMSPETVVGAISTNGPQTLSLKCQGNGVTTYDIANITLRMHDLSGGTR
jgi:hypothetical protein